MSAASLGALAAAPSAVRPTGGSFGSLKSEDFIRVMMAEMSNQDPFEPQDSGALLEQLSSLRTIESQLSLQDDLKALVLQNQVASASALIGKSIAGLDDQNQAITGIVTSVRVEEGQAVLELDSGARLPMGRVTQIAQPPAA